MLQAQNRHAISANTTASGRGPAAKATPAGIDAAMAAPGAMSVMLWNRTSRRPIALRRNPVVVSARSVVATAASLDGPYDHCRDGLTAGQERASLYCDEIRRAGQPVRGWPFELKPCRGSETSAAT